MKILEYGAVIMCRDITFEDGKYDLEKGHPGVIILPTNEKQDYVYCLYMTSDKERAKKEKNKFLKFKGESQKESYVNFQQIIKRKNIKELDKTIMKEKDYIELIKKFYYYQKNLKPKSEYFMQIEDRVKLLLEVLNKNQKLSFYTDKIDYDELHELRRIKNMDKALKVYGAKLICFNKLNPQQREEVENEFFTKQRDKKHFNILIEIYERIKGIDISKLDLQQIEDELQKIYYSEKNNNPLINMNSIFKDLAKVLKIGKGNKVLIGSIENIAEFQTEREKKKLKEMKEFVERKISGQQNNGKKDGKFDMNHLEVK